jgi:hypothetical protein
MMGFPQVHPGLIGGINHHQNMLLNLDDYPISSHILWKMKTSQPPTGTCAMESD